MWSLDIHVVAAGQSACSRKECYRWRMVVHIAAARPSVGLMTHCQVPCDSGPLRHDPPLAAPTLTAQDRQHV